MEIVDFVQRAKGLLTIDAGFVISQRAEEITQPVLERINQVRPNDTDPISGTDIEEAIDYVKACQEAAG